MLLLLGIGLVVLTVISLDASFAFYKCHGRIFESMNLYMTNRFAHKICRHAFFPPWTNQRRPKAYMSDEIYSHNV